MITHLEPDILECEVKWALESITTNKASEGDGIPFELFQILKMMLWKCCTQYACKFGKLSSGHRTGKVSFHSNSKECSNYCKITLISHTSKAMLKILQARLQQYMNRELPDVQLNLEKAEEPEIKLPNPLDHQKCKRVPEKHLLLLYWLHQSLWLCGSP